MEICENMEVKMHKHKKKNLKICIIENKVVILHRFSRLQSWRDGRVVDYNGLENRRTERYRGFESLSLRHLMKREPNGFPFFVPENQLLAFLTR